MTAETIVNTRGSFRLAILEQVRQELSRSLTALEGGALDGIEVVSAGHIDEALNAVKGSPLPPIDDTSAEVKTPADVYVDAICPECDLPTRILVEIEAVLQTTRTSGSVVKVQAKAKSKTHVHHQLSLEVDAATNQTSFGLEDIVQPGDELTDEERAAGDAGDVDLSEGAPNADDAAATAQDDDEDLRPTREINADELRGLAERSSEEGPDDPDLLPF